MNEKNHRLEPDEMLPQESKARNTNENSVQRLAQEQPLIAGEIESIELQISEAARRSSDSAEGLTQLDRDNLERERRIKEADGVLSRLILASDLSPNAAYYIARVAVRQGRNEQAKQMLEGALKTKLYFAKRPDAEYLLEQLKK